MALSLAKAGHDVALTYQAARVDAQTVVADIERLGRRALALQLDVGAPQTFPAFVGALKGERLHGLVHNGGSGANGPFVELRQADVRRLIAEHFEGPFFLTQALLPLLNDGGRIVHVSTAATRFALPGVSAYAAVKAAIESLTRSLALELGPRGITVNAVAPGGIATDFAGGVMKDPAMEPMVRANTALGRMGLPDDVASVVTFLASPESRWVTGQRIELSGGFRL